jgi:hypothetical protein
VNLRVNEFFYLLTWSADFCDDAAADFEEVICSFSVSCREEGIYKGLWEGK